MALSNSSGHHRSHSKQIAKPPQLELEKPRAVWGVSDQAGDDRGGWWCVVGVGGRVVVVVVVGGTEAAA